MLELTLPEELEVLVVLGSISDKSVAQKMQPIFSELGIKAHFEVCSAHRDHERLAVMIPEAEKRGAKVFIGVAGMAAHLPGVIAALTVKPVIGVACSGSLEGMDALLSIAQMPPNIPVAAVAINGGRNAALLAAQILATSDNELSEKLKQTRVKLRESNRADSEKLRVELHSAP